MEMSLKETEKPYLADRVVCECCGNADPEQFSEQFKKEFKGKQFIVLSCNKCSFNFLPWHYRKDIVYTDYKDEAVLEQIRKGNDWLKVQRHLLRFKLIRKYKRSGDLFDLGVGWGHFLLAGQQLGYTVYGIEISKNPYIYSKEDLGLPVDHIDFFDMQHPSGSFDIITLWDVLEHIDKANPFVEKCADLLRKDGYIVIQVPQIDSFIAKWQKEKWNMMSLDHVNYFSRKTITKMLENNGFEVVKIKSSIELKLLLMYTILPWIKKLRGKKEQPISSAERQEYYNKTTQRPKWVLRIFVAVHNVIYRMLSFFRIGEEMIVVARKK
jgi:2-polyprenyl-3-methyl-5-hydroxy-6-metoxy-1,4-benzoquinol methylase